MVSFELSAYLDIPLVVRDAEYAKQKNIIVKKRDFNTLQGKKSLYILRYDKEFINFSNINTLGLFRSVITDGEKILSFSPPKSVNFDWFASPINDTSSNWVAMEFCEGTMINLFFNPLVNDWEVATKGTIGARCKFYQHHPDTFRFLFLDAMNKMELEFTHFSKDTSYSFVLQHPSNRIVVSFTEPRLQLVNSYTFDGTKVEACYYGESWDNQMEKQQHPRPLNKLLDVTGLELHEIKDIFTRLNLDYRMVGAIFIDKKTGMRTKLRNPTYEYVRNLKGNSPKLQFQYYELRKMGKVGEYLKYYPENKVVFGNMREALHRWTNTLQHDYIACYIKKQAPLRDFPYEFRPHMFALHRKYLNGLPPHNGSGERLYISRAVVIDYVNNLETPRLMFSVNYNHKQKLTEEAIIEAEEVINTADD